MSDYQLIQGCINGELAAQQAMYDKYCAIMFAICFRYAKNRNDAEDMLQEGFTKVFTQLKQFRGEGSFEGWVKKIIVNTCINHLTRNKKFKDNVEISHAAILKTNTDDVPSLLQAKQIIDCIRLLPIGYRTVLNLYALEGYSHREIAQLLDIEESTSRSQYTRAKSLLQHLLEQKNILPTKQNKEILTTKSSVVTK